MAVHDISPAFVKIDYETEYARHKMTIPTVPVSVAAGGGALGLNKYLFTLRSPNVPYAVGTAIQDFLALLKEIAQSNTHFTGAVLYTKADADSPAIPVASEAFDVQGTANAGGTQPHKATQITYSYRTDLFGKLRLILLDAPIPEVRKYRTVGAGSDEDNVHQYVIASESWLAGRDGGAPASFVSTSQTYNDRLERAYTR